MPPITSHKTDQKSLASMRNLVTALMAVLLIGCAPTSRVQAPSAQQIVPGADRLFIVGQDLGAIRGYFQSNCCPKPDGTTAYVDLFNVMYESGDFGGLGVNTRGNPIRRENTWGAGPVNAWVTATEFDVDYVAIGLSMTENFHPGALNALLVGSYDPAIRQLAQYARSLDQTVLLRIGYEFDGFWNEGYADAERYTEAFRYIVDGLRSHGAINVQTVWQGAASTTDMVLDQGRHDEIRDWYPGDNYVDWMAISWFMEPDKKAGIPLEFEVLTPRELSDEMLSFARERNKPVLIAEASPQGFDLRDLTRSNHSPIWDGEAGADTDSWTSEAIWDTWFQPLFDYMHANDDVIRGLAYINARWDDQPMWGVPYSSGYWGDSRVEANPLIAERFSAAIEDWRQRR